jgi:hypothetical protein
VYWAVIVAVALAGVMEMSVHEIVDVVSVREGRMPAARAVLVVGGMLSARMRGRAGIRVGAVHLEHVLVDVTGTHVVKVPVVGVVSMPRVTDLGMTAARPVSVRMILVGLVIAHGVAREQ